VTDEGYAAIDFKFVLKEEAKARGKGRPRLQNEGRNAK